MSMLLLGAGTSALALPLTSAVQVYRARNQFTGSAWTDPVNSQTATAVGSAATQVANVLGGKFPVIRFTGSQSYHAPSTFPINQNSTVLAVYRPSDLSKGNTVLAGSTISSGGHSLYSNSTPNPVLFAGAGNLAAAPFALSTSKFQMVVHTNTTFKSFGAYTSTTDDAHYAIIVNNRMAAWGPSGTPGGGSSGGTPAGYLCTDSSTYLGGFNADTSGASNLYGDLADLVVYSALKSAAELNAAAAAFNSDYGTAIPPFAFQILLVGDSLTAGYYSAAPNAYSWATQMALTYAFAGALTYNLGCGGALAADWDTHGFASVIQPLLGAVPTLVVLWAGSNDCGNNGETAAAAYASFKSVATKMMNAGAKVLAVTMNPRAAVTETVRTAFNNALLADAAAGFYTGGYFDTTAVAGLGQVGNNTGANYYSDNLHYNQLGQNLHAQQISPLIAAALGIPEPLPNLVASLLPAAAVAAGLAFQDSGETTSATLGNPLSVIYDAASTPARRWSVVGNSNRPTFNGSGSERWLSFSSGSGNYLIVPDVGMPAGALDRTGGIAFRVDASTGSYQCILLDGPQKAGEQFAVYVTPSLQLLIGTYGTSITGTLGTLTVGTWYRLIWTISNGTLSAYLDGSLYGTPYAPSGLNSVLGGNLVLGYDPLSANYYASVSIAGVILAASPYSAAQIARLDSFLAALVA